MTANPEEKPIRSTVTPIRRESEAKAPSQPPRRPSGWIRSRNFWVAFGAIAAVIAALTPAILWYVGNEQARQQRHQELLAEALRLMGPTGEIVVQPAMPPNREYREWLQKARMNVDQVLEDDPDNAQALTLRGAHQIILGQLHDAEASLTRASELDPDLAPALYNLAVVRLRQPERNVQEAVSLLERAAALDQDDQNIFLNLGMARRELGRYPEAVEAFGKAANIQPTSPSAWEQLGITCAMNKDYDKAVDALGKARRFAEPSDVVPAYNLGELLWRLGRYAEAIPVLEEVVEKDAEHGRAYGVLGWSLISTQRLDEAEAVLEKCIQKVQESGDCHEALARILMRRGRSEDSIPHWKAATRLEPRDLDNWRGLVEALEEKAGGE